MINIISNGSEDVSEFTSEGNMTKNVKLPKAGKYGFYQGLSNDPEKTHQKNKNKKILRNQKFRLGHVIQF